MRRLIPVEAGFFLGGFCTYVPMAVLRSSDKACTVIKNEYIMANGLASSFFSPFIFLLQFVQTPCDLSTTLSDHHRLNRANRPLHEIQYSVCDALPRGLGRHFRPGEIPHP